MQWYCIDIEYCRSAIMFCCNSILLLVRVVASWLWRIRYTRILSRINRVWLWMLWRNHYLLLGLVFKTRMQWNWRSPLSRKALYGVHHNHQRGIPQTTPYRLSLHSQSTTDCAQNVIASFLHHKISVQFLWGRLDAHLLSKNIGRYVPPLRVFSLELIFFISFQVLGSTAY